ncbi:MAG: DUF1573 domain-containing protein [Spirochaetales bacterium]|nr:DUF1573 domain-containing protein [Spirochaetales bacterium]
MHKKRLWIILIIIIGTIAILPYCTGGKGPEIFIDGDRYKFGEVVEGKEIVFTFFISNTGTKDFLIEELYVSCECVIVKEYDRIIKPGTRGSIYGVIRTTGFRGFISKSIKLKTNIGGIEPVLTMEGTVVAKPE